MGKLCSDGVTMRDLLLIVILVFVLVTIVPTILANLAQDLANRHKVKSL